MAISIKNDFVLSHIEALEAGTKISVRGLAAELGVSEGTVYKAIKEAEIRGYVITKPKSGTFKVEKAVSRSEGEIALFEVVAALGLTCVCGKNYLDNIIDKIIVCDGSENNLTEQLSSCEARRTLCILSDRPDLETMIVQYGANILLTSGARPTDYHIVKAEKNGVCILSALQSTYTVAKLFYTQFHNRAEFSGDEAVSEWMQIPNYLYQNDIVADWQRFYMDSFNGVKYYPVVDDELKLYGGLNIAQTFVAANSQRLSNLTADKANILTVGAEDSVREVAQKMLFRGSPFAVVTQDEKMEGIIYPLDLLRYFVASQSERHAEASSGFTFIPDMSTEDRKVYELQIKIADPTNSAVLATDIALRAATMHLASNGHPECSLESSSFFHPAQIKEPDGIMMSTTLVASGNYHYSVDIEIYSEREIYTKGLLIFSEIDRR